MKCCRLTPFLIQALSLCASIFCVVYSVFQFIDFNIIRLAVNAYILCIGILLIVADIRAFSVFGYIKGIYTPIGRGLVFVFLGCLMFFYGLFAIISGTVMIGVGVLYFLFAKLYGGVPKPILQRNLDELPLNAELRFVTSTDLEARGTQF